MKMVIFEEGGTDKTMNSHEMRGKNEKFLKTVLKILCKTSFFCN